jgi:four helix bundle suffix protein
LESSQKSEVTQRAYEESQKNGGIAVQSGHAGALGKRNSRHAETIGLWRLIQGPKRRNRPNHPYAQRLRRLNRTPDANYQTFTKGIEHPDPSICANVIVGLIKVTCYLLDQQLRRLERDFLSEGGLRERMTRARLNVRARQ